MATKEKPKVKPDNIRQKKVAKEVVENGSSMGAAMRGAGYSEAYSKHPEKLKRTDSWQELMEEYLPDSLLAEKHEELLRKTDKTGQVDAVAVPKGLDMAYKLKGKFAPEQVEHRITAVELIKYGDKQDPVAT